jgi:pyruvate/2-oxoglutarate dehydrogenase complex dihydrolipoamide dehydrogenase (E3) component
MSFLDQARSDCTHPAPAGATAPESGEHDPLAYPIHPLDVHNRNLLANAHPAGYRNPAPTGRYNLVVIGAGTAGLIGSLGAAGLGGKVALIERHLLGGDCLNWGCVPSKSIIRSAKIVAELRKAAEMGVHAPDGMHVDFGAVMARMRSLRAEISHHDSMSRLTDDGVEVFLGEAKFTGPNTIEVFDGAQTQTLHFAKALIATGGRARTLPVPGLREAGYLTNETLFQLTELPRRLAVIGGGPIGAEMAQAFARFGAEVTVLLRSDRFLPREDRDAAAIVQRAFEQDGIRTLTNVDLQEVSMNATGKVLHFARDGRREKLEVDAILLSIGRTPNVDGLGLESAGVAYTERGVQVDDHLRTTNPHVFAAGDVALETQFTHMADASARIVLQNALFPGPKQKLSDLVVPWTTFTDPEVAHVGMYVQEAEAAGIGVETFTKSLSEVDRSRTDGATDGFVKVHVKRYCDGRQVASCTKLGSKGRLDLSTP